MEHYLRHHFNIIVCLSGTFLSALTKAQKLLLFLLRLGSLSSFPKSLSITGAFALDLYSCNLAYLLIFCHLYIRNKANVSETCCQLWCVFYNYSYLFLLASLKKCYENTKGVWFQSPKLKFTFSKIASKAHMKEALLFDWVLWKGFHFLHHFPLSAVACGLVYELETLPQQVTCHKYIESFATH